MVGRGVVSNQLSVFSIQLSSKAMSAFRVVFRKENDDGFTVTVPSLPGCVTFGETLEEAMEMVKEAIELCLESLQTHGEEIKEFQD